MNRSKLCAYGGSRVSFSRGRACLARYMHTAPCLQKISDHTFVEQILSCLLFYSLSPDDLEFPSIIRLKLHKFCGYFLKAYTLIPFSFYPKRKT